jgi:3alpha(or 20beta)-hydroxysteroid dehydrogenase
VTDLADRTVVVTGAASGIGAAVVTECVKAGATVVGLDVTPAERVHPFDVADEAAWARLAAGLYGTAVHGLVNCAGTTWRSRLGDVTAEAFQRVQSVNVQRYPSTVGPPRTAAPSPFRTRCVPS